MNKITASGLFTLFILIVFFAVYGVFTAFVSTPEKKTEIQQLQNRVKILEANIDQYKSAMKFENLFMIIAKPNQVMDMEALEEYIKERKDFYKRVK